MFGRQSDDAKDRAKRQGSTSRRFASRQWTLVSVVGIGGIALSLLMYWGPLGVLVAGLLLTGLLAMYLLQLRERTARVEETVAERTAELQQANEALHHSEQRFRSLVETTSDWIWAVDPDGVYTYASPKIKDLLGYEPEEVVGKTPFDMMPPDEAEQLTATFREIVSRGEPFTRLENANLHKDGHRVILETSGVPIFDAEGNLQGYRGVDRDVTKPKEDEAKLKRTMANLEQSNRDLEQFAYSASHDLQEPLRMLGSYLQALEAGYGDGLDQPARDYISLSIDAGKRMQQLINALLAYAHVGTRGRQFQTVATNTVVDQVIVDLQAMINGSGAEVTRDELPSITADPTLLAQLFQNLIGNAIKFHGDRPPEVHVRGESSSRRWVFSVRDNGIGIDQKHLDRIFAVFERLHSSDKYPGTGIGLAICKRVVQHHGGRIWCESTPQEGTTFHFSIPREGAKS